MLFFSFHPEQETEGAKSFIKKIRTIFLHLDNMINLSLQLGKDKSKEGSWHGF